MTTQDISNTYLVLKSLWLNHLKGSAIHLDEAISPLAVSNSCGCFLLNK